MKYRKSRIRNGILEYLRGTREHPSAEDVHREIKRRFPTASFGTVYRNLNILVDQGEAERIESSRDKDRFDAQGPTHAHFRCDSCGGLFDVPLDIGDLTENVSKRTGHRIEGHSIEFNGICSSCSEES